MSTLALAASLLLKISHFEFLLILALIGVGLAIELLNTGIEETIDAIHKNWSDEIRVAKDSSAAAMLIFAVTASIIAGFIFIPKILDLIAL